MIVTKRVEFQVSPDAAGLLLAQCDNEEQAAFFTAFKRSLHEVCGGNFKMGCQLSMIADVIHEDGAELICALAAQIKDKAAR